MAETDARLNGAFGPASDTQSHFRVFERDFHDSEFQSSVRNGGPIHEAAEFGGVGFVAITDWTQQALNELSLGEVSLFVGQDSLSGFGGQGGVFCVAIFRRLIASLNRLLFGGNCFSFRQCRRSFGLSSLPPLPSGCSKTKDKRQQYTGSSNHLSFVLPHESLQPIRATRRTGFDRFIAEEAFDVADESVGGFVSARTFFFEGLHHDPVEVAGHGFLQVTRIDAALCGDAGEGVAAAESGARSGWFNLLDQA